MTVKQLTEQLVKMANDQLDKSVASAKSAASSVASKLPPSVANQDHHERQAEHEA